MNTHTSRQTITDLTWPDQLYYIGPKNIKLVGHPPHSLDLAPNDIFLCLEIKDKLRDQCLLTPEEAAHASKNHVVEASQAECEKCYGS